MNTCDSLHHIMGRGSGDSELESSILNAAPLCNQKCHLPHHGRLCTPEYQKKFLNKTYEYLMKRNYFLTELDLAFMEKYAHLY